MKHLIFLLPLALAFTGCENEVAREHTATPTPPAKLPQVPPTPVPNKLKGTTLDRPTPRPHGKVDPNLPAPYISPLEKKPN